MNARQAERTSQPTQRPQVPPRQLSKIAVLVCALGGIGGLATVLYRILHSADGQPFPTVIHHIDTDPSATAGADLTTYINLDRAALDAMRGSPRKFDRNVETIIDRLDPILSGDPSPGARTTRACSQLSYAYHRDRIIADIGYGISLLTERYQVQTIVPFILCSSGGGTGSALSVLLMRDFKDPDFRHRIRFGHQAEIHNAVVILNEPYAHVRNVGHTQAKKIQANMYAFRLETDYLQRKLGVAHAIYHLGLANRNGVVLSDADSMSTVLGHGAYYLAQQWEAIRSASCDNAETNLTSYGGYDTLESQRPDVFGRSPRARSNGEAQQPVLPTKGTEL